jgi:8-oxo-dGTP pyrophosphatase MutT (NUDIX family)
MTVDEHRTTDDQDVPSDTTRPVEFDPTRLGFEVPPHDELVSLVDDRDQIIGVKLRSHLAPHDASRVVNAFAQRPDGKIWVPTRADSRVRFPGALDFSVGGHVRHGEDYMTTLVREASEHAHIDLTMLSSQEIARLGPTDGVSDFMAVYIIRAPAVEAWDAVAFRCARWLKPAELATELASGAAAKPDLAPVLGRLRPALEC